jgi:sugar phosphate isomerase/epimerase
VRRRRNDRDAARPVVVEAQAADWKSRIGLERYTVRDQLASDFVTMPIDIGWTCIAGVDPIALFKQHPGRFELWQIKDVFGLKTVNPSLGTNARVSSMAFAPVGVGQIDFKPVFANAALAGLKHFVVEHDNAAAWGDSRTAARVSYQNLAKILS